VYGGVTGIRVRRAWRPPHTHINEQIEANMKAISFLGTTDYLHTTYVFEGQERYTRFFPAAVAQFFKPDKHLVCATPVVQKHTNLQNLQTEIESLGVTFEILPILDGNSEADLWTIFDAITSVVDEGETVVFDVTHSFRSLPILVFLAVAYLKAAKRVQVAKVVYGAFEARTRETNISPVFDLTPFVSLLDWLTATTRFVETGDGHALAELLNQGLPLVGSIPANANNSDLNKNLGSAARSINQVSLALQLTRPIEAMESANQLENALMTARSDIQAHAHPFGLLANQVIEQYGQFAVEGPQSPEKLKDGIYRQLRMIDWYNRRGLVVQAATLSRELVISLLAFIFRVEIYNKKVREDVEGAINNSIAKRINKKRTENLLEIRPMPFDNSFDTIPQADDICSLWNRLRDIRNDIAHVGMRQNAKQAAELQNEVKALYPTILSLTDQLLAGH
jgi:CRISPR-associated DxTHG motif protein